MVFRPTEQQLADFAQMDHSIDVDESLTQLGTSEPARLRALAKELVRTAGRMEQESGRARRGIFGLTGIPFIGGDRQPAA